MKSRSLSRTQRIERKCGVGFNAVALLAIDRRDVPGSFSADPREKNDSHNAALFRPGVGVWIIRPNERSCLAV